MQGRDKTAAEHSKIYIKARHDFTEQTLLFQFPGNTEVKLELPYAVLHSVINDPCFFPLTRLFPYTSILRTFGNDNASYMLFTVCS